MDTVINFKIKYKGLNNLYKFTNKKIMEIV